MKSPCKAPQLPSSLEGRVVLVAGGTGGLGSVTTLRLARQGAIVVAGFRSHRQRAEEVKKTVEREGGKLVLVEGDLQEVSTRRRYVEAADGLGEGLYGLVCFPGDPARVPFERLEKKELQESLGINYCAPLLLAREAAARMQARQISGAVVLISTMQAVAPFESSINYAVPKAALLYAARILAKQWGGPGGIRVNVVAPGVMQAGMALQSITSGKYDRFLQSGIIPRFGRPEDVARAVEFFLEPDNYITGQVLTVDGGLTLRRDRG